MAEILPTPRTRHRRRMIVAAVAAAVVAGGVVAASLMNRPDRPTKVEAALKPPAPAAVAPATSAPTAVSTVARPSRRPVPHDRVAPAVPTAFTFTGPRFTIKAHVCAMADVRPYDPPGEQHHTVCWVRNGFGVRPGSGTGTSYLFGHSWAPDPREVLNRAAAPATAELLRAQPRPVDGVTIRPIHVLDGYRMVLRTRAGTLTYAVRDSYGVRKTQLGFIKSWFAEDEPNRIVLTTCAERNGVDYDFNIVIEAYLVSSKRA
jgi:hypothetical protein